MKFICVNPLTPLSFLLSALLNKLPEFSLLYFLIFLHESAHFLAAFALRQHPRAIHLLPWGCMLSLDSFPAGLRGAAVFFAGPLLNLILCVLGFFPRENLFLALFNLLPVVPLDGGEIVSLVFPKAAEALSVLCVLFLALLSVWLKIFPFIPIFLAFLILSDKKSSKERALAHRAEEILNKKC